MKLGAITVVQNIRAMVAQHDQKLRAGLPVGVTRTIDLRFVLLFVRATRRGLEGPDYSTTVELARIDVAPRYRGRGLFKYLIKEMEDIADLTGRAVFVESILNERLAEYLLTQRVGYQHINTGEEGPPSLYRLPMTLKEAVRVCMK